MRRALLILLMLWLVPAQALVAGHAWAQGSAVELARDAKGHYDRGQWAEALALFDKAEALAHSPVLVLFAARCQRNLGQLVKARTLLTSVANEKLAADAPAPFVNAQRDAKADLEVLRDRIPKLSIDRQQAPTTWTVEIDGTQTTAQRVEVDPGVHLVVAKEGSDERFREEVDVAEGTVATVTILPGTTLAPKPGSAPPMPTPDQGAADDGSAVDLVPGIALLAAGVVAGAVGIGLRVSALATVDDVKSRCLEGSCLREDEAELDEAITFQTVSTVLFIAGGALAATGIVLLVVLPGGDTEAVAPSATLRVSPTGVTFSGTF